MKRKEGEGRFKVWRGGRSMKLTAVSVSPLRSLPAATCPQGCRNGGVCVAPGICSCPEGWLGGACHTGELGHAHWDSLLLSLSNIVCNSLCVCVWCSSGVFAALPERRKVCFSQQVSLPPAVFRPPLPGEEEVQLVWPCWRSNDGEFDNEGYTLIKSVGLFFVTFEINEKHLHLLYSTYCINLMGAVLSRELKPAEPIHFDCTFFFIYYFR